MIHDKDHYRERCSIYVILAIIILTLIVLALPERAFPTTVTGVVKVQGQPLTGFVDVSLVYPATTGSYIALPGSVGHLPVTNGSFDAMTLEGNDTLLPRGTYYQFLFSDAYGTGIARLNYVITGATFDIGTAVPTPVTTNNVNFLDLIGIRNLSTTNLTVLGNFNLSTGGMVLSPGGISGAKTLDDFRYAAAYLTGSTTCGVAEAIAALPAVGGTVYLPIGTCVVTSTIGIAGKHVRVVGHGMYSSDLVNQTGGNLFAITAAAQLSDFTIDGPGAVGSGNGVVFFSGGSPLVGASMTRLIVAHQASAGVVVGNAVSGLSISNSYINTNTTSGVAVTATTAATVGTSIRDSYISGNGGDGVLVDGASNGDVSISNSVITSNIANGVDVTAAATTASVHVLSSTLSDNHQAGWTAAGGYGHTVDASQITAGAHQLLGITMNYAGAAGVTQLEVKDSFIYTNLTKDLTIGPLATGVVLYPPTVALATMNTAIDPAAGVTYVQAVNGNVITPTCTASGCWIIRPDTFIEQWGITPGCTTSGSGCTITVAFPHALTTISNVTVTTSCFNGPTNCVVNAQGITTSNFIAAFDAFVRVGGSGSNLTGAESVFWHSIGH